MATRSAYRPLMRLMKGRARASIPWQWLIIVAVLHGIAGLLLAVFSAPLFLWPLALIAILLQTACLAGPVALGRRQRYPALLNRLVFYVGATLAAIVLAVGVGYGGTADIDEIRLGSLALGIAAANLGVVLLSACCSLLIAYLGDRLVPRLGPGRSGLLLLLLCYLGLAVGGITGVAIATGS